MRFLTTLPSGRTLSNLARCVCLAAAGLQKTVGPLTLAAALAAWPLSLNLRAAPGTVIFANSASTVVIDGRTGTQVSPTNQVKAALYWAPLASSTFVQIGDTVTSVGSPLPGLF